MAAQKTKSVMIQFALHKLYAEEMLEQIDEDVERSGYSTRTKYFNALLKRFFSIKKFSGGGSCLGWLFRLFDALEKLPYEEIQDIAKTRNRNFIETIVQMIEEAVIIHRVELRTKYSQALQKPVSNNDVTSRSAS